MEFLLRTNTQVHDFGSARDYSQMGIAKDYLGVFCDHDLHQALQNDRQRLCRVMA